MLRIVALSIVALPLAARAEVPPKIPVRERFFAFFEQHLALRSPPTEQP